MLSQNLFNSLFVIPLLNLLVAFYKVFEFLKIPGALGWAILLLTLVVKALTYPFFKKQLEAAKKMQELKPELEKLSKKYKDDKVKLQKAQIKLYQKAGVNPAAGCLLPLVQLPIFFALYRAFLVFLNLKVDSQQVFKALNKVLYTRSLHIASINPYFFGFDLTLSPAKAQHPIYYTIPVITGFLQYYQSVITTQQVKAEDKKTSEFQQAFQSQSKIIFPLFLAWISFSFPVGLSLYWNFFTLLSIFQMRKIRQI